MAENSRMDELIDESEHAAFKEWQAANLVFAWHADEHGRGVAAWAAWKARAALTTAPRDAGERQELTHDERVTVRVIDVMAKADDMSDERRKAAEEIEKFVPGYFSDTTLCPKCNESAGTCPHSFVEMLAAIIARHCPDRYAEAIQARIDYHDVNGSMAEAADMPESAAHHDAIRKELEAIRSLATVKP